MKKLSVFTLSFLLATSAFGQEVKTGWNFGALPAISFSTDQGFQYGALVNLFDYGDGSIYPDYYHKIYIEASTYTKGSSILRVSYESDYLIPGIRYAVDLSYMPDYAYNFYGFNGFNSVYNKEWVDDESTAYRSRLFYAMQRHLFRFKNDFTGKLGDNNWFWNAGLSLQSFKVKDIDVTNSTRGRNQMIRNTFRMYLCSSHIIKVQASSPMKKLTAGLLTAIKGGISYDTRDNRACPMKGIWAETGVEVAPEFLGGESTFGKFYFTWRQYFTLKER